jgi:hypothetical protein
MTPLTLKSIVIAAGIVVFTLGCQQQPPTALDHWDTSDVVASLQWPIAENSQAGFTKVVFQVTAKDMDTLKQELLPEAGQIQSILKVPSGNNRIFKITAFKNLTAVMSGSDTLNLASGKAVNLNVKMNFIYPAMTLSPVQKTVAVNDTFTVYFKVHKVDSLSGVGVRLSYDKTKLDVQDLGREDAFLTSNGGTIVQLQFNRDAARGQVNLILGVIGSKQAVSGAGLVGRVRFKALVGNTTSELTLVADPLVDSNLGLLNNKGTYLSAFALGSKIVCR